VSPIKIVTVQPFHQITQPNCFRHSNRLTPISSISMLSNVFSSSG